jgi:transposase InsO family protein
VGQSTSDEAGLVAAIREQAQRPPSYGYRRVTMMLKRAGWSVNHKRVHRLWQAEGLQLPRRRLIKRRVGESTQVLKRAEYPNHVWTYDFMSASTERGGKLRILNVLDEYTRECLAMHVASSIGSRKVIDVLEWLFLTRSAPGHLRSDNSPEFIAYAIQDWLVEHPCQTLYIPPGSPWENPFGRIPLLSASMGISVLNAWIATCSPLAGRPSRSLKVGVWSIIVLVRTAAWTT